MKVWLGAAAALSGAGTLVYLLVRSSQRGRGNGTSGKASETQTARGVTAEGSDTPDTSIKKDGSCERLNGHLCMEEHTDSATEVPDSAPCQTESKQQRTLTPGETCDASTSVERLSSNLDENVSELVSAIQEKIVVKEDNVSNTSTCEEVTVRPHKDDREISQPGPKKDEETREHSGTRAVNEQTVVASDKKELHSASNPETISSGTDFSSMEGTWCASRTTETSPMAREPVVEELSQCRILRPQCDPCCHEEGGGCHHTTSTMLCMSNQSSDEHDATLQTEEAAQKSTQLEDSGMPSESLYTLDCSVSGKPSPDTPTNEAPLTVTCIEGQERGAELNKDEPETCIVTIEQRAKVYAEQMPTDPLSSGADERTPSDNAGNSTVVLQTDSKMEQPLDSSTLQTDATVQEQRNREADSVQDQGQSDNKLESPQEQKRNVSEEEKITKGQEHGSKEQLVLEEEDQSSCMQQEAPQEQKSNASEQDKDNDGQKHTGKEQLTPKEEKQEEKQDHGKEKKQTPTQEQSESRQEVVMQSEEANQEKQSSGVQEAALENKEEVIEKQEHNTSRLEAEQTPRQSGKKQEGKDIKEHQAAVEAKQSNSNKQAAGNQKKEPKEGAQKQKESDKKQRAAQQEQLRQKEGAQKQRESDGKQKGCQQEHSKQKEGVQKQRESNKKQKAAQQEEQSRQKEGTQKQRESERNREGAQKPKESDRKQEGAQKQKESNKNQKTAQNEAKSINKQDTEMQKPEETDNKQEEQLKEEEEIQKQRENDKNQRTAQKEVKSSKKQDAESDSKQVVTPREGQTSPEEGKSPERNAKNQVTGDSTAHSPSRPNNNNGRKGTTRSRGDSASADLDCDLGSEHDNLNCDSSSLKSMDSGQGSSEIEPETLFVPSTFPVTNQEQYIFYDFEIPQMLVGRLIGRKGAFINKIKAATEATVIVHPHKNRKLKLCSVEGTKHQVNAALEMIREHFPESQYPDITLQQVSSQHQSLPVMQPTLNAPSMQIELTTGVVVEVRVSSVVSGGELWVQQPLHPSYSALHRLQTCMNLNYGDGSNTPPLPNPISDGTVCVANIKDHWMRCQVLSSLNNMSLLLPLDVGGTVSLPSSSLRQIRYDYMTLPFQATQCFLHGLQPVDGDTWSDVAASVMEELVSGVILFAVVVSYTEDYVPLVNLYRRDQDHFVLLNEKMVELGHAQWISPQPSS